MEITDIRVRRTFDKEQTPHVRAIVSVTFDNMLAVHEVKVIENDGHLFVAMPSSLNKNNKFRDIVHPINSEARAVIEQQVISAYQAAVAQEATAVQEA